MAPWIPFSSSDKIRVLFLLALLILLSNNYPIFSAVAADDAFTSSSGLTFSRSSREPKYKIEFHTAASPFYPDNGQESMVITNKEKQNYLCFLPIVEETKSTKYVNEQNTSTVILETDKRVNLKTPDELIDVIKDKCFYRHEGWWSYEFCYQKHVRQLHVEDDKIVQEFVLGVFDEEATTAFNQNNSDMSMLKDPRSRDAAQRYHAHQYTNGTVCDLTDLSRETEVRFVCSEPTVIISSIKEISTCKYAVTIECPMLCRHPMFHQERPTWHTIHCNEMSTDTTDSSANDNYLRSNQITILTDDADRYAT